MQDSSHRRSPALILITDDSKMIRQMGRESLEQSGFEVVEAEDGEECVRSFRESGPDLVLLDVEMPKVDGFTACEEIRQSERGAQTPVLMMTGRNDLDSIRRAYEAGATDFSAKPVNWTIIGQRVRYMLRMNEVLDDLRRSQERLARAQRIARLGNWELDLAAQRFTASEELCRLYGLGPSEGELSLEVLLDRVHVDDRGPVRNAVERCASEGTAFSVDHRVNLPGGRLRNLHLQADAIPDEAGRPIALSGTAQDITDRKRAEEEIRFLAYHDGLTRLANRRLFSERLRFALAHARRHRETVAVLFLDLDHFKRINDTLGHTVGDLFLQRVADRLKNCVRESDCVSRVVEDSVGATVSRFGGDEFMVALSSIQNSDELGQVAQRILDAMARPFELDGNDVVITASIGIAVAPEDGEDVDSLIRNADAAMFEAKNQSRGTYKFYELAMNEVPHENLQLESDLRKALDRSELLLHYQPKVELAGGRVVGFEALARWQHPKLGMIPPDTFVPVAEQAGLIVPLGEFVLRSACSQVREWREMGLPPLRISVNLSAHQFRTEELVETVTRVLRETPVSPRCLDVEITESAMMQNQKVTVSVLQKLKGIGITVSLDDFGTGYSSLSYLKGFPVDTVKIDRSFVRDLMTDPDDAAITAAIISMAKTLNLRVTAEGVETEEQLAFLRAHGCDEMQGYLFSPPMPADRATEMLREMLPAEPSSGSDD
ncbi:MAG: EAL domain-containing protein [Myxococcales bacterium]|nr:EAL domain-containing protein [Myxococcales bacterium]